jgi:hypothetical protein
MTRRRPGARRGWGTGRGIGNWAITADRATLSVGSEDIESRAKQLVVFTIVLTYIWGNPYLVVALRSRARELCLEFPPPPIFLSQTKPPNPLPLSKGGKRGELGPFLIEGENFPCPESGGKTPLMTDKVRMRFWVGFLKEIMPRERSEHEWRGHEKYFPVFPGPRIGDFQHSSWRIYWAHAGGKEGGEIVQTVARDSRRLPVGVSSPLNRYPMRQGEATVSLLNCQVLKWSSGNISSTIKSKMSETSDDLYMIGRLLCRSSHPPPPTLV